MEDPGDKMIWDALLRQAEANLRQAAANEGTSSAIKLLAQRLLCRESVAALEPDRFAAWHAADGDAEAITSLSRQIAQKAYCSWHGIVGGMEGQPNIPAVVDGQVGKQVMGTKKGVCLLSLICLFRCHLVGQLLVLPIGSVPILQAVWMETLWLSDLGLQDQHVLELARRTMLVVQVRGLDLKWYMRRLIQLCWARLGAILGPWV